MLEQFPFLITKLNLMSFNWKSVLNNSQQTRGMFNYKTNNMFAVYVNIYNNKYSKLN